MSNQMFNAQGKRLFKEKHTGTVEEQLRSLTAETQLQELREEQDKLQEVIRILRESPRDSGTERHCLALLKGYQTKLDELRVKVLELGNGFELMTSNFFTDVNRLVINVPLQAPARRTPIMPHEQDATRKKRKTAAPRPPGEKKGRKKRLLKPQKVAPSTGSSNKKRAARAAASTSGTLKLEHP